MVGAAVGAILHALDATVQPALVAAAVTLVYRLVAAVVYRKAGQEIEHPMAVVIVGGLVTSTLLNVFVVRALYLVLGRTANAAPGQRGRT